MSLTKKIVGTYAKSFFQNVRISSPAQEKRLVLDAGTSTEELTFIPDIYIVGEELILLRSAISSSKRFSEFFKNPTYSEKQKFELLTTIFPGLTIPIKAFLKVLTERSHLALIPEISEEYSKIISEYKKSTKVKLVTASILQESSGNLLLSTLKTITDSTTIVLQVAYNPKLLGGLLLEYKSSLIDLSILKEFSLFFTET